MSQQRAASPLDALRARRYVVSQYHSNMGNTGAFCIVHETYKYIAFGHGFNRTFGGHLQ